MLPNYFDYIFVHPRQKLRLRPELSPKFWSTLGLNPARTRPEKPGPTYNSAGNQTPVYRFSCRRSIHSTIDRFYLALYAR